MAAARARIEASRNLRQAMTTVAERSELAPEDLVSRFGFIGAQPCTSV
jgi:hypothetical protein